MIMYYSYKCETRHIYHHMRTAVSKASALLQWMRISCFSHKYSLLLKYEICNPRYWYSTKDSDSHFPCNLLHLLLCDIVGLIRVFLHIHIGLVVNGWSKLARIHTYKLQKWWFTIASFTKFERMQQASSIYLHGSLFHCCFYRIRPSIIMQCHVLFILYRSLPLYVRTPRGKESM